MSQPVKLSDSLILDARLASECMQRSIAGQVELWARLGAALAPLLQGTQVMALRRQGAARSLMECLADIPENREQVLAHLKSRPFPHYEPDPDRPGLLIRTAADGTRTVGRFVNRAFHTVPVDDVPAAGH